MATWQQRNKYKNRKTEIDGIRFDSVKEARRWRQLRTMEEAGEIMELRRQVKFVLIPVQKIDGKMVEREVSYYADFVYVDPKTDQTVVEDAKGIRTQVYVIKRKLLLERFGIRIKEV